MSGTLDPWREYADSCLEHDPVHGEHALAELASIPRPRTPYNPAEARAAAEALLPSHQDRPPLWRRFVPVQAQTCAACGHRWWWPNFGERPATCPTCRPDAAAIPAQWEPARMRTALHLIAGAPDLATARRWARDAL